MPSYSSLEYTGLTGTGVVFRSEAEDAETQNLQEEGAHNSDEEDLGSPLNHNNSQHHFPKGAGQGDFPA